MQIGIIGAGNIGAALARRFVELGHDVTIANSREPETIRDVADSAGQRPPPPPMPPGAPSSWWSPSPRRACPSSTRRSSTGHPTPSSSTPATTTPARRKIEAIEDGTPESQWVAEQLGRPVVKAFNNIHSEHLANEGRPWGTPGRIALPFAGDDPDDKAVVARLIDELGFDAIDAGTLEESWRQQPGTPVYGTDHDAEGVRVALASASPERPRTSGPDGSEAGQFSAARGRIWLRAHGDPCGL